MTEKHFWFINFFCHYIFQISVFLFKNFNPLKKVTPSFSTTLFLMMMSFQVPSMQWCMYFMFLLYFFTFASFYNQYLFINCRIPNHFRLLYDNIQVLAKITVKFILLFYQKRFKFWFSRRQIITHGMRAPFLKLGRCWWILNCHKSRELLFSGILGGGLISLGGTFFAHKLLYKNLNSLFPWIYIS